MPSGHLNDCEDQLNCFCKIKTYWFVLGLILVASALEFFGGWYSGSFALLSDAAHVALDSLSVIVAIVAGYCVKIFGQNPARSNKINSIGGYINATLLGLIAIWILHESWERISSSNHVSAVSMIVAAAIGATINWYQHGLMEKVSEGDGHHDVLHASLDAHILGDMLNSIAVIVAAALIWLTGWMVCDLAASAFIALWMIVQMVKLFKASHLQAHTHEN